MTGQGYSVFDTAVGRCAIAWSHAGIAGVQLPELREIETRRRLLRQFPDVRERRPSPEVEIAIGGITALLQGRPVDLSDIALDMDDVPPFSRRVYDATRTIPRGETRTRGEIAALAGVPGATHAVGHAILRNPFALLVPCHRVLEAAGKTDGFAANGSLITRFRLLTIEGALSSRGPTLFDALLSVARPRLPS